MDILLNCSQEELKKLNTLQKADFLPMPSIPLKASEGVAVVIEGDNFSNALTKAVSLNIPVVIIAGLKDENGERYAGQALECGVPAECIVFKCENRVISKSGKEFTADAKRGISLDVLIDICSFAQENNLYPELLIWEEPKKDLEPQIQPVRSNTLEKFPYIDPGYAGKISVVKRDLIEVIDWADYVIAVFKTTDNTQSSKFTAALNQALKGMHLEISSHPGSHLEYGLGVNDAIIGCQYAYSNGKNVEIHSSYSGVQYLVVEMAPSMMESMACIYVKAKKVVQVTPITKDGIEAIRAWLNGKFVLNAIIPEDMTGYSELQSEFGELVLPDAAAFIEREIR